MGLDRDLTEVRRLRLTQKTIIAKRHLGVGRETLIAEVQVFPHEGFQEGDYVILTIEKNLEK